MTATKRKSNKVFENFISHFCNRQNQFLKKNLGQTCMDCCKMCSCQAK